MKTNLNFRIQKKRLPLNCIQLHPSTLARVIRLASESSRDAAEIVAMAVVLFDTATRHLNIMHPMPVKTTPRAKAKSQSSTSIGSAIAKTVRNITRQSERNKR